MNENTEPHENGAVREPEDLLSIQAEGPNRMVVGLKGDWRLRPGLPNAGLVEAALQQHPDCSVVAFNVDGLHEWNSGLVNFVLKCDELCQRLKIPLERDRLPPGLRKLMELAQAVPEATDAMRGPVEGSWVGRLGAAARQGWLREKEVFSFVGESLLATGKMFAGKAQFRSADAWLIMQQCGPEALGVVALINFLVGVILAFVGSVQLRQFGASIYVADLVAIGTVREMGCIMTGVILCGRTGAAFAAQLGAMKVNEEIDAFKTFGISPFEFLVLPRILALLLMMPLLCVFADAIAILGGFIVSISMLDVTWTEYVRRTLEAITLKSFLLGVFKGGFFGILVAISGCLRGMQCGTNAAAVGQATTSAVVTGITSIVAADGLFAVLCNALKI